MKIGYLVIGAVVGLGLATAAAAADTTLKATLAGSGGSGSATVKVDEAKNQVCWDIDAKGLTDATMAHIHKGASGASGPPVVPFTDVKPSGESKGCTTGKPEVVKDLVANPGNYYVNVHTKTAPGGAIRGQLGK